MELARNDKNRLAIEKFFNSYLYQYDWLEFTDFMVDSIRKQEDGTFLVDCMGVATYGNDGEVEMEATFVVTMEDGEVAEVEAKSRTFYGLPEGC